MHSGPGETDHSDAGSVLSRRDLVARLGATAFAAVVGLAEADVGFNAIEAAAFVANAPSIADRLGRLPAANLGNISAMVQAQSVQFTEIGDSESKGWTDTDWELTPPAQVVASDLNDLFGALHIPRPDRSSNPKRPYVEVDVRAVSGTTIAGARQQVAQLHQAASLASASGRTHLLHVSAGGNDALRFLEQHQSLFGAHSWINDFRYAFLPRFQAEYEQLLADITQLANVPSMSGLCCIYVTGTPDLGLSRQLDIMRVPGVAAIVRAGCQYINACIFDAVQHARQTTQVEVHYIDTFTGPDGQPIPIDRLHPTHQGYSDVAHNIEAATSGTLPDGSDQNLLHALRRHGVVR